ncbi:MAG: NB-ARC domain-containing protein [Chloroflexota bacterium]
MSRNIDRPDNFQEKVHAALRAYTAPSNQHVLSDLLLFQKTQLTYPDKSPRLITNDILHQGLQVLQKNEAPIADIIERRFLQRETASELAYKEEVAEASIYRKQQRGLGLLAECIWQNEIVLQEERKENIFNRLEVASYIKLFGIEEILADIVALMRDENGPKIIALEGLGGLGKTSLANAIVHRFIADIYFFDISWVTARQRLFYAPNYFEDLPSQPQLTISQLVHRLINQFNLTHLKRQSEEEQLRGLKAYLDKFRCLVIIDNLETVKDYQVLVSKLKILTENTTFLITTRFTVGNQVGVHRIRISEMSRTTAHQFIRYESNQRRLTELAEADQEVLDLIYDRTGGNPLVIKIIVGYILDLPLSVALDMLRLPNSTTDPLFEHIYGPVWDKLDADNREVLQAMTLIIEEGGDVEQIAAIAEMDIGVAAACLTNLASISLVHIQGSLGEKRYGLHQVTRAFLERQAAQDDDQQTGTDIL